LPASVDGTASPSLPLDGPGRLGRDVVDHPVDAAHLVDDAGGGAAEEVVGERVVVGGHAVGGDDGTQGAAYVFILANSANLAKKSALLDQ